MGVFFIMEKILFEKVGRNILCDYFVAFGVGMTIDSGIDVLLTSFVGKPFANIPDGNRGYNISNILQQGTLERIDW